MMMITVLQLGFIFLINVSGEEINLYGDMGQAYAIDVYMGHPHQKLRLILDTGSTTLAIAGYARKHDDEYFHMDNSSSINDSGKMVEEEYSKGSWSGKLVSDFIQFPSLSVPEVRTDIGVILKSHEFFMNSSGWQGLLGLAYNLPVTESGNSIIVDSWIDSMDRKLNKTMSFQLKFCGKVGAVNMSRYGYFKMIDDAIPQENQIFRTPVLKKLWYEVGVISVRVLNPNTTQSTNSQAVDLSEHDVNMCLKLNAAKGIVDSGTTNIKIPNSLFRQVVNELKDVARSSQILILDEFWYDRQAACWPEPQEWTLPWLGIDILSMEADNEYFTLEIPPQSYMLQVSVNSSDKGTVGAFCYKLGIDRGGLDTIIGYIAMEGLQVTFNRSAGWIGWRTSNCGVDARVSGPYNVTTDLKTTCNLIKLPITNDEGILILQWMLDVVFVVAVALLIYGLLPCIKWRVMKRVGERRMSFSQASLLEDEPS